jgi:hypothetical protein
MECERCRHTIASDSPVWCQECHDARITYIREETREAIALHCEIVGRLICEWWVELEKVLRPEIMQDFRGIIDAVHEIETIVTRVV